MNQQSLRTPAALLKEFEQTAHPPSLARYEPVELLGVLPPLLAEESERERHQQEQRRRWLRPAKLAENLALLVAATVWLLLTLTRSASDTIEARLPALGAMIGLMGLYHLLRRGIKRLQNPTPGRRWQHLHDALSVILKNHASQLSVPELTDLAYACLLLAQSDSPFVAALAQRLPSVTASDHALFPQETPAQLRALLELPATPPRLLTALLLTLEDDPLAHPAAERLTLHPDPRVREAATECLRGMEPPA